MSERVAKHIAALRRQHRRTQRIAALAAAGALAAAATLMAAPTTQGGTTVLMLAALGYAVHKGFTLYRIWRIREQLRLEEQFVLHGPGPDQVRTCLRNGQHLWASSLILQTLRRLRRLPSGTDADDLDWLRRLYRRSFRRLRPSRWPLGLIGLSLLALGWLWLLPTEHLTTPAVLIPAGLLGCVLAVDVVLNVLRFDLRAAYENLTHLLTEWSQTAAPDDLLHGRPKPYRHTALYRTSSPPAATPPPTGDGADVPFDLSMLEASSH